jgi:hypothetical protein
VFDEALNKLAVEGIDTLVTHGTQSEATSDTRRWGKTRLCLFLAALGALPHGESEEKE